MSITTWIVLIYLFANLCTLVHPQGKFPDIFYDDDGQKYGHKGHKHRSKPKLPHAEMGNVDYPGVPEDAPEKPANAMTEHEASPPEEFYTINEDIKTIGRGDPSDQDIIEQEEIQDKDSVFPKPDGKPFTDDDNYDLDEMPKRLTQTNRWPEFNELITAEQNKYKGKVMKNWHANAHKWAGYSRHLLERSSNVKQKTTPPSVRPQQDYNPNVGLSPYWEEPGDNKQAPEGSPAVPWGHGKGPGAGIEDMKDLGGPEDAQGPFPWDAAGGQGPVEGPGGGRPPGLGQGGQFPGGGFNMGGGQPPGMGQGGGQGPGGQFPGGGFNMGGGPPPGMGHGGGQGPGGQFPGGGFNMGGSPPPGMGHGGGQGPGGQFPGGGFNMGGGPPPGMGHGGGQGPGGQFPGGGFNMGGGPPPGMGHGGGQGPGGQFPGGGFNTGGGPPPGMGQGGGPGPGGQFSGGGFNMGGGPPPGMVQGSGGQFPGSGFNMGGGPPPGMGQDGVQGGGRGPGGGFSIGGAPPSPGLKPEEGLGQNRVQSPGAGHGSDGGYGPVGPPGPAGGWVPGRVLGPGMGPGMGRGPGMARDPGRAPGLGGGRDPRNGRGSGGGSGMSQDPSGQGLNGGYGPVEPPGPASGWAPGRGQRPGGGQGPGTGPEMGRDPGNGRGSGEEPGMSQDPSEQSLDGGYSPVEPPGPAGGWVTGKGLGPGRGLGPGMGPGMGRGPGISRGPGKKTPGLGEGRGPGNGRGSGGGSGISQDPSEQSLDGGYGPVEPPGPAGGWVTGKGLGPGRGLGSGMGPGIGRGPRMPNGPDKTPGLGEGRGLGNGRGSGGGPGISQDPSGGQGLDGGYGPVEPPGPAGGWVPGGGRTPGMGQVQGMFNGPGGPPGTGASLGAGRGPSPELGWGPRAPPGVGKPPGSGGPRSPFGPPGPGRPLGSVAPPGSGGPPGPGGLLGQGGHRRTLDQTKKNGVPNMARVTYYDYMNRPTRTPDTMPPERDTRFLLPGTNAEDNLPKEDTNIDFLRFLSAKPKSNNPHVSFDKYMSHDQVPTGTKNGKIPGPGSEGEYPNGYRPYYGDIMQPGMASSGGHFGTGQPPTGVSYSKANPLRQGQGVYSTGPADYQDSIQNALRMGQGPHGLNNFQPGTVGGTMARGRLSGNMQRWQPGIGGAPLPPAGYELRGRPPPGYMDEREPRGMGGDISRDYMQEGPPPPGHSQRGQAPGMGGSSPQGYMQGGRPPGMGGGLRSGYTQGGQPQGMGGVGPLGLMPTSLEGFRRSLDNSTVNGGSYPGPLTGKPTLRYGGGLPSMEKNVGQFDEAEIAKSFLRMNQIMAQSEDGGRPPPEYMQRRSPQRMGGGPPPGYMQGGPPPGMGGGPSPDYMQGGPPPGMEGGPPPGYMQGGPPPGMEGGPPPGYMQGGPPPEMEDGPPPGYMQGGPPPGMGRPPSSFQGRPRGPPAISRFPPGMPQGQMGGPGGDDPSLRYGAQGSPQPKNILPSGYQLMKIAQRKIEFQNRLDKVKQPIVTTTEHLPTVEERLKTLRQFDDFHAPIRWVKFYTPDTKDGLARVTDKNTHQNQQFVIEGELYVPIVDESMARLGWTTESENETLIETTTRPNVEEYAIKIVMRSMNLNYTSQQEWLAYETILGAKFTYEPECSDEACQSRCHKAGCDCTCQGDSCASGCVGVGCNAICKGPGCNAMCIGDQCTAKCEGLNCDAKCWGTHCSSSCSLLSCSHTTNGGRTYTSNMTWDEAYPQYGHSRSNQNPDVNVPVHREGKHDDEGADEYYSDD